MDRQVRRDVARLGIGAAVHDEHGAFRIDVDDGARGIRQRDLVGGRVDGAHAAINFLVEHVDAGDDRRRFIIELQLDGRSSRDRRGMDGPAVEVHHRVGIGHGGIERVGYVLPPAAGMRCQGYRGFADGNNIALHAATDGDHGRIGFIRRENGKREILGRAEQ